jgi:hypothetical protein
MIWWFLILAFSTGAVLWVGIALYLRIRSHIREAASKEVLGKE